MDISREDLQRQYDKLSDIELLEIYNNRSFYTDLAVDVMTAEIKMRNLDPHNDEVEVDVADEAEEHMVQELPSLRFAEKLVAYFCFPFVLFGLLFFFFLLDPKIRQTYQPRVNQAFYFVLYSSVIVVFLALLSSFSILHWRIEIWAAGFLIPYVISLRSAHQGKNVPDEIDNEFTEQAD